MLPRRWALQLWFATVVVLDWCGATTASTPAATSKKKASFGVRVQLLSGWPRTPPTAQSLEWLHDLDAQDAGQFLRESVSSGSVGTTVSPIASKHLQSGSAKTFHELLVRNAYYSPRIEMLRTLERRDRQIHGGACAPGVAWALIWRFSGTPTAACDAESLRAGLSAHAGANASTMPDEFVPSRADLMLRTGSPGAIVVVYGALDDIGLPSLASLLKEVDALDLTSPWTVYFRHADSPKDAKVQEADLLTGYGFELAIKSSEYKTHADEKKDEDAEAAEDGEGDSTEGDPQQAKEVKELDGPLEMDGLLFHVLLKRSPDLRSRIWAFKEQLEAERDTDVALKAWEIKDIGLQATAKIQASATPLVALMRLSQNFPAVVGGVARMNVPEGLRKAHRKLRRVVRESSEVFSVNNRLVRPDHSDLSLFPMMKTLQPFFVGVERLVRTGIPEKVACEILKESHGSKQAERIDWRSPLLPPPVYHVSKDRKSAQWPQGLMSLMYAFPGGLAPVRMALYNMVFVFDPAEVAELVSINTLLSETPLPVALHLVLVPKSGKSVSKSWNEEMLGQRPSWVKDDSSGVSDEGAGGRQISHMIAAAYGHLVSVKPAKARTFLRRLGEHGAKIAEDEELQRFPDTAAMHETIQSMFEEVLNPKDTAGAKDVWASVLSGKAEGSNHGTNAARYAHELGVPVPSMLMNGKLLLKTAFESLQTVYTNIAMEQQSLMRLISTQPHLAQGSSEDSAMDLISGLGFLAAYHADITPEVAQRGGEDGMPGKAVSASYLLWPTEAFLALPFLQSGDYAAEGAEVERLSFYHITVIRRLSQSYLLESFATHLLGQPQANHFSHWSALIDTQGMADGAMTELRSCVRGIMLLETDMADSGEAASQNRRNLQLLKFLGAAIPAAMAGDSTLPSGRVAELCDVAISKKLDPDVHDKARASVKASPGMSVEYEATLLESVRMTDAPGDATVWVCNGRQIALEDGGQPVSARHILTLEVVESQYDNKGTANNDEEDMEEEMVSKKAEVPIKTLREWLESAVGDDQLPLKLPAKSLGLAAGIRSEALSHGKNERFIPPKNILEMTPAAFRLELPPPRPEAASPIKVFGLVDPLSTTAQSASAVLALFGMAFNAEVTLILNPVGRHSEYPLKTYYREVIRWPDQLADGSAAAELEGGEVGGGHADFQLATQHTLTAAVHALPTWLVTAFEAQYDMDNLRLVDVGDGRRCNATYVLRDLYVEGQAFVLSEDGWPVGSAKGLHIDVAAKGSKDILSDTFVMGNHGYFQVHGNPGLYEVTLKPGLSNDTFLPASMKDVEVSSYITPPYQLRLRTRPGRSHKELFDKGAQGAKKKSTRRQKGALSRLFGGFAGFFLGDTSGDDDDDKEADAVATKSTSGAVGGSDDLPTIHIFSVASGHLYEKLLGIMILSVRNRTKCPLHFWFIDQFLSPTFKSFIPKMAKRYHFDFEFVTYKWPSWLNPQSEKQRLIWAYKVLFLDVLFPLDVPKVIFIDADQVVRADVRELWDMDLQGNVYGFVPMGDSNPDVEGFRFWKQGYWQSHLRGLPYHISALFVVDLEEFRRTSTGDSLRGVYNQLSQDPNSLANLDQDLPNFAQHQIPIFSLPQDWLWCETWCSQESKATAKTIDLCQNPLTKEPKIVMAKRIISEWQDYHDEVGRFELESLMTTSAGDAEAEKAEL